MTTTAATAAHSHDVQFYADDGFLADGVATFIAKGLTRGHAAIIIATVQHWHAIETRLDLHGITVPQLVASGQLTYLDAQRTLDRFMRHGLPDAEQFQLTVASLVQRTLTAYPALCAYGEMVDLLSAEGNHSGTLALEELWNRLLAGQPAHLLCGYRLDRFDREAHRECFRHICHAHAHVLPTESFTQIPDVEAQRRAVAELQQLAVALRAEVQARAQAEAALKLKADDLERSNAELQRFAFIAAHDLQEPLRMVTQYLDLVRIRGAERISPEIGSYIGHAVHGAERMRDLVQALLTYERLGKDSLQLAMVDTHALVSDVCCGLATELTAAKAHLSYADLPTIRGDRAKLTMLLRTLLENAVAYRSTAPLQVSISAVKTDARWIVSVRDNGIGIDPAHHATIFGVFQRLHQHETIPGTGIGLAICKRLVEQHAGSLWVESSLGLGSTFRFSLPA